MNNEEGAREMRKYYSRRGEGYECGQGSTIENTVEMRKFISEVINKYDISSINDAPCGSFNWMSLMDLKNVEYIGFDIDSKLIERNKEKYPDVDFIHFDITKEILPRADLIICRDCLFHLPTEKVINTLKNFRRSNARFLLSTSYSDVEKNLDIIPKKYGLEYGFRKINLCIPPFNMGKYIDFVEESKWGRVQALWEINRYV